MATVQNTLSMIVNNQLLINMMLLVSFLCRCDDDYFRNNSGDIKPDRARTHLWLQHINEHRVCMDNIDLPVSGDAALVLRPLGSHRQPLPRPAGRALLHRLSRSLISTISTIYLPYLQYIYHIKIHFFK